MYLKREYVIRSERNEFYGMGGWVERMDEATRFVAEDALAMLATFPKSTAVAITTRGQDRRQRSLIRSGQDRRQNSTEYEMTTR